MLPIDAVQRLHPSQQTAAASEKLTGQAKILLWQATQFRFRGEV